MELVVYVDSCEALRAAVARGADGVRIGLAGFCASPYRGFGPEALAAEAAYCRARGVSLYVGMEKPVPEARFSAALASAEQVCRAGAAAVCLGDVGLLAALRQRLPETALHADTALHISDSAALELARSRGFRRVLLPPRLSREALERLRPWPLEVEACLHGPVCSAPEGRCAYGALAGACTGFCRERFTRPGTGAVSLALADISLAGQLPALAELGVQAVHIRGPAADPRYTALATELYRRALDTGKLPAPREQALLDAFSSPGGVSGALFEGRPDEAYRAPGANRARREPALPEELSNLAEYPRVPVTFWLELRRGAFASLTAEDGTGLRVQASGPVPERAGGSRRAKDASALRGILTATEGTPFVCREAHIRTEPELYLPGAELGNLRREALGMLLARRALPPPLPTAPWEPPPPAARRGEKPDITVFARKAGQLSPALAALKPRVLYLPLYELLNDPAAITPFWENGESAVCAVLPAALGDAEVMETCRALRSLGRVHVREVLVNALGQIGPALRLGFRVRAGLGLAAWNSAALRALRDGGAISAMLSPALNTGQICALDKCLDTELFAYGRLPLLGTDAPGGAPLVLEDARGRHYPLLPERWGRSVLYSPDKLFMARRLQPLAELGLWCLHLAFTTEQPAECAAVAARYLDMNTFTPNDGTKGFYNENKVDFSLRLSKKAGTAGDAGRV